MAEKSRSLAPEHTSALLRGLGMRAGRQLDRLDHWPLDEWSGAPGLRFAGSDAVGWAGVLVVPVDTGGPAEWRTCSGGPAWIRWIGVDDRAALGPRLRALLRAATQVSLDTGMNSLWLLCDSGGWLDPYLGEEGHRAVDEVISLELSPAQARPRAGVAAPDPPGHGLQRVDYRFAQPEDIAAVVAVDTRAFRDPWRYSPATLARELSAASVARLALQGNRLVGYATGVVRAGRGHINRIAVDPEAQGRGVGRGLLADIRAELVGQGATQITLNTQRSNVVSQRLYRSFGFRSFGPPLRVYHRPLA